MNIKYFQETDTLYIEFRKDEIAESRDLDGSTVLDVDADGNIYAITAEHASDRADIPHFSFEQVGTRRMAETAAPPAVLLWRARAERAAALGGDRTGA